MSVAFWSVALGTGVATIVLLANGAPAEVFCWWALAVTAVGLIDLNARGR